MPSKLDLIVVDTNLWLSFLISKSFSKLDIFLRNGTARLIFSTELLEEFIEVVQRPKFKKIISASEINKLLSDINQYADFVDVTFTIDICRDPKDNFLLALCKTINADFLLTGDEDLLILKKFGETRIISLGEYLSLK